jgi:hypothetical protein
MTPVTKADGERNAECSSFVVAIVCCVVTFFDSNDLMLFTCFCCYFDLGQSFTKRCRTEAQSPSQSAELQKVLESQASEIQSLKSEKAGLENSFNALKGEHDKVVHENRTLKKAVLIQQERQNHSVSELDAARRYRAEAEDKIKKLEHLVLSLRYHLQTQNNNSRGNDFMGFPPRPPDVY